MALLTLTKAGMAETLYDELGLTKREAKGLVDLFFEEIRRSLEDGEPVKLSGFGGFDLRQKMPGVGETRRPARRRPLRLGVWSHFGRGAT